MKRNACWMLAIGMVAVTAYAAPEDLLKKWDKDSSGGLSKEEFTAMTKAQFEAKGKEGYEAEAAKRFERRDTNKDGSVTLEEMSATLTPAPAK